MVVEPDYSFCVPNGLEIPDYGFFCDTRWLRLEGSDYGFYKPGWLWTYERYWIMACTTEVCGEFI